MKYLIKKVRFEDLEKAFSLIWTTFLEFVAPDYSKEGVETFKANFIENEDFRTCFKNGKQVMYGAYLNDNLIGVISISSNNHISFIFVDKNYHRNGVATMLLNKIILESKEKQNYRITLNASPYAIPFYRYMGFKDLDMQKDFRGILYTPMELIIDKNKR